MTTTIWACSKADASMVHHPQVQVQVQGRQQSLKLTQHHKFRNFLLTYESFVSLRIRFRL